MDPTAREHLRADAAVCACSPQGPCFYHNKQGGWEEVMEIKRAITHLVNYGYRK